jgi:hypothetical protein
MLFVVNHTTISCLSPHIRPSHCFPTIVIIITPHLNCNPPCFPPPFSLPYPVAFSLSPYRHLLFFHVKVKFAAQLDNDVFIVKHLETLYEMMLEGNLAKIIAPFSRVEIDHVAKLIDLPAGASFLPFLPYGSKLLALYPYVLLVSSHVAFLFFLPASFPVQTLLTPPRMFGLCLLFEPHA